MVPRNKAMNFKPNPVSNAIEAVFGSNSADAGLKEILTLITTTQIELKEAIKRNDLDVISDGVPRLSILQCELASKMSIYKLMVGSANALFESEKERIYKARVDEGSSSNMAHQISGRMVKKLEADYISLKYTMESLEILSNSNRFLISDLKSLLDYNKSEILKLRWENNNNGKR